jgi:hypothetical protein
MCLGVCRQPPGLLRIPTRGPWPRSEQSAGFDWPLPATVSAGGEGGVGEKDEQANSDLWVHLAHREKVGGGESTEECGRWRRSSSARVLLWLWARIVESVSTVGSMGCSWEGPIEQWMARVVAPWQAAAIGARLRRRDASWGNWSRRSGRGAALGRGKAIGGGCRGGAAMQWRLRGGVELAGVSSGAAAAFWGVWAGKERESKGERSRRAPWY